MIVRSAPGLDAPPPVKSVRTGAHLLPLARQPETGWLQVQLATGEQGWINPRPSDIYCDVGWATAPLTVTTTVAPTITPIPITAPPCSRVQPRGWVAYRIRQGDTLGAIARRSGSSVTELMQVNCLPTTVIRIGDSLFVPGPPVPTATPTFTPTETPTPTLIVTVTSRDCDPPLALEQLNTDPTQSSLYIVWSATGGCDPVSGTVVVNFSSGEQASAADSGRSGSVVIPYPASDACPLNADYTLTLTDGSGQSVSVGGSVPLRDTCPTVTSTATPTFIPIEAPTATPTETLVPIPMATPTTLPTDMPTVELVATATYTPVPAPTITLTFEPPATATDIQATQP